MKDFKLCYVDRDTAYFTTQEPTGQELSIWAGTSIEEFKTLVKSVGGKIFIEEP